ncbi:MAG: Txe/YoeB family addiction module toxin [Verrucomicrobiaceae bacterium]|nr:MAG: Txe/YoeB family addiction module toxin [Verrucomicrobiaceae bacterium]
MRVAQLVLRTPDTTLFTGLGKPEPLKHRAKASWSRRIDHKHRLVHRVQNAALVIISCRFHY